MSVEVGEYARKNLPEHAVLMCEDRPDEDRRKAASYLALLMLASFRGKASHRKKLY